MRSSCGLRFGHGVLEEGHLERVFGKSTETTPHESLKYCAPRIYAEMPALGRWFEMDVQAKSRQYFGSSLNSFSAD